MVQHPSVSPDQPESDEQLAIRARTDAQAFGQLYERHLTGIYTYIYYRVSNQHVAEDLAAQTFMRALRSIHRYEVQGVPFAAWLFRIAHNLVANWHRDSSRHAMLELPESQPTERESDNPEEVAERREAIDDLHAAIQTLAPDRQQLLLLKFVVELPNARIAEIMGRTEGAIKALLHRTVASLKDQLSADQPSKRKNRGEKQ